MKGHEYFVKSDYFDEKSRSFRKANIEQDILMALVLSTSKSTKILNRRGHLRINVHVFVQK